MDKEGVKGNGVQLLKTLSDAWRKRAALLFARPIYR
jgi:hypothetical protein